MRRIFGIAAALLILLTVPGFGAKVTNVELSFIDGATVARIHVDGVVRFTHQTEIPKDGRPNRVILDVLSATHELGAKNFTNLPNCPVSGIRTSQFSVTPEKIVRLVFDLSRTPLYRIESDSKSISVIFAGKNQHAFAAWSSSAVDKMPSQPKAKTTVANTTKTASKSASSSPLTVVQRNKKIDDDRLASLSATERSSVKKSSSTSANSAKPLAVVASPKASTPVKSKIKDTESVKPSKDADRNAAARSWLANQSKSNSSASKTKVAVKNPCTPSKAKVAVKNPCSPSKAKVALKSPSKTDKKVSLAQKENKSSSKAAVSNSKKASAKKATVAVKPHKISSKKVAVVSAPSKKVKTKSSKSNKGSKVVSASKTKGKVTAKKTLASKSPKKAKPVTARQSKTSRFRRNANSPKMRRTMVAEFPKRLVIKYKARGRRDPFASLLDETRTYNSPIEQRIPNVEGTKLVGIIEAENGSNRALLEDKEGYGYILKSGDKVRNGYVLRVENDKVYFQIFEYGWSRTIALSIY